MEDQCKCFNISHFSVVVVVSPSSSPPSPPLPPSVCSTWQLSWSPLNGTHWTCSDCLSFQNVFWSPLLVHRYSFPTGSDWNLLFHWYFRLPFWMLCGSFVLRGRSSPGSSHHRGRRVALFVPLLGARFQIGQVIPYSLKRCDEGLGRDIAFVIDGVVSCLRWKSLQQQAVTASSHFPSYTIVYN